MTPVLVALQTEAPRNLPIPAWLFGLIAFAILLSMMLVTLAMGKGRPHS